MRFAASIVETDGALEGSTLEKAASVGELTAFILGRRIGNDVTFTKVYDALDPGLLPIAYTGLADAKMAVVQGRWRLISRDSLRGGFVMRRISSNPVFGLSTARGETGIQGTSVQELRAREEAIRRRRQIWVSKPRRRRPKGLMHHTKDHDEGVAAMLERREPVFRGE